MKTRFLVFFLVSTTAICGCASIMELADTDLAIEGVPLSVLKYGKYCGPGHPSFESTPGSDERTDDLNSLWPPEDDIDTMCYLHDMCYQATDYHYHVCDEALLGTLTEVTNKFTLENGCENMIGVVSLGFISKFWGSERDSNSPGKVFLGKAVQAVPGAVAMYWLMKDDIQSYGLPDQAGNCFVDNIEGKNLGHLTDFFEDSYFKYSDGMAFTTKGQNEKERLRIEYPNRGGLE